MRKSSLSSLLSTVTACLVATACAASDDPSLDDVIDPGEDTGGDEDGKTDSATATAICNAIPTPRPWTKQETDQLLDLTVARFSALKRDNDALIKRRGVGAYAGVKTEVQKAIDRRDWSTAAAIIRPRLKPGYDARTVVKEIAGTSCIGRVYAVLREVYAELGRAEEWKAIEKCGRAWASDGLHVQQALIKNGWPSPTLPFVSDALDLPGSASEVAIHEEFLRAVTRGTYYGTPVSKTAMMKNFLPSPGSTTTRDERALLALGRSRFLGFGTLRGAFHVPLVAPAASIPVDLAPASGTARTEWLAARDRGEPFILESHSLRQPWDPTNFEIRPLTDAIDETLRESVTYATGTLLLAQFSELTIDQVAAGGTGGPAGCESSVVGGVVPSGACVQRPSDQLWFRCSAGAWLPSGPADAMCTERHPL